MNRHLARVLTVLVAFCCLQPMLQAQAPPEPTQAASPANTGFKKRILVYLDASGSMDPLGKTGANSAFRKTLGALAQLLKEPGLVGAGDKITVFTFGEDIVSSKEWDGGSDLSNQVEGFRPTTEELDTNLDSVFRSIESQLGSVASFDRQLVLIASDFFHQPKAVSRTESAYLESWSKVLQEHRSNLEGFFSPPSKALMLLLKAQPSDNKEVKAAQSVRKRVIEDLAEVSTAKELDISTGGLEQKNLATEIRKQLYRPLSVIAFVDRKNRQVVVEVSNQNAVEVNLSSVDFQCIRTKEDLDKIPLPLNESERRIGPIGSTSAKAKLTFSPNLDCLGQATGYQVTVRSSEGAEGFYKKGDLGAWIQPRLDKVYLEDHIFESQNAVRITVWLRGDPREKRDFEISLRSTSGSAHDELSKGWFRVPGDLEVTKEKLYQMVFALNDSKLAYLDSNNVTVEIQSKESQSIRPEEDDRGSLTNKFQWLSPIVLLVIVPLGFKKRKISESLGIAQNVNFWIETLLTHGLPLVPWLLNGLRVYSLGWLTPLWSELLKSIGTSMALAITAYFAMRWVQEIQFARMFTSAEKRVTSVDSATMERHATSIWPEVAACIGTFIVTGMVFWLLRSPAASSGAIPIFVRSL